MREIVGCGLFTLSLLVDKECVCRFFAARQPGTGKALLDSELIP